MRRLTAIAALLYFLLLPGAAILAASDNSVPPCCRANGAHHCCRRPMRGSGAQISATNNCPYRIGDSAVTTPPFVAERCHILPTLGTTIDLVLAYSETLLRQMIRTAADRGPPALFS